MTLLKDNNYKDINVALLSLEADIKNKITNFDTSAIDKQLAEINSRIDKINAGGGNNSSDEIEDINSKLNSNSIKIRNIEQNVEDIDTQINGIEQKLSDIFSAENKVTDFNTTTDSGIYYWVADAANRPTDYGVLLVNKYDGGDSASNLWVNQVAYGTNNKIYFRQNISSAGWTEWKAVAFDGEVTAYKVSNALTVNGKTYDGSSAVNAGVQTVANGGTGATDAAGGFNTLASGVPDSTSPADNEKMLFKPTGSWYKTTCLDFWNYIKGKISSVLGLTATAYSNVQIGRADVTGTKLVLQGMTVSSNSYADANPKLVFNNADGKQSISLTFTDYDAIKAPSSLTLNGNQGNEYFIAPCIKANNKMVIPIGAPSSPEDGCIWIER